MEYPKIKYVEPLKNYKLFIIFENGEIKFYSVKKLITEEPFSMLKNEELFFQAKIEDNGYGVVWNDEIDISEYELWKNGVEISTTEKLAHKIAG
jgi:Protein of unknown function (DUF2442)